MRARRAAAGIACALGLVAGLPAAASAEPAADIDHVEVADDGTVSALVTLDGLSPGASAEPTDVAVEVDGEPVEATARPVANGDVRRATVLALDASLSMRGARLVAAREAATAFLASAPADVQVGLLTFAGAVRSTLPPSGDRDRLAAAVAGIRLTGGTRVYDAVVEAARLAGTEGSRHVLLLSDGRDQGGGASLDAAVAAVRAAGVVVDVVTLEQVAGEGGDLARIAEASGGRVIPAAEPRALEAAFAAEADSLASQVLVSFPRPDVPAEAALDVTLTVGDHVLSDSAFVSLEEPPPAATASKTGSLPAVGRLGLLAGAAGLGMGLALVVAVVLSGGPNRSRAQRRLAAYLGEGPTATSTGLHDSAVALADKVVGRRLEARLIRRLAGAGMHVTPAEWVLMHTGAAVVAALLGFVLVGPAMMVMLLLLAGVLPVLYLRRRHGKRLAAFGSQLPETLGLMAGGLSAGLSLPQAVDTVVREGHEPMAGELRRALVEQRLGVDVEDALDGVADRMQSEDFSWVVMAVRIQREAGGNLSEILTTVSETLREREYLRRQVRSLSAEGRLSAWILSGLPVLMFVYMLLTNEEYVELFWTEVIGMGLLLGAVVLLAGGSWVMSRLVKVQV